VGDRVYATLGYGKPVAAFDAATGKTVRSYEGTEGSLEILLDDGKLCVLIGDIDMTPPADPGKRFYPPTAPRKKGIIVLDAVSGIELWKRRDVDTAELMPTTLAVSDGRLFFQNTRELICLDADNGQEEWRAARPVYTTRLSWSTPNLVVSDGVVLSADGSTGGLRSPASRGENQVTWHLSDTDIRRHPVGDLVAFSAETGRRLWTGKSLQGFCNPGDLFVIDGKVWCGADVSPGQALLNVAVDLKTGEVLSARPDNGMPVGGHTRCYRNKATERFLVLGDIGVEFVNLGDWSWNANPWVRGTCQYGVMPCNGLLYVPPDSCACRPDMRLHGFSAMAPAPQTKQKMADGPRLTKGPAYTLILNHKSQIINPNTWPTYRGNIGRTGRTTMPVPTELKDVWQTKLGGELTSLTVGAGKVYTACVDDHTVYALDAKSGKIAWSRTVGGVVDSPPTVHGNSVLFGCRDGRVYCLSADDGRLAWQFRAAPRERLMVAMENVESTWPVHGSVLVRDRKVWCAAGRSPYLDGGIRVYALEAATGKVVSRQTVFARGPQTFNTSKTKESGAKTAPGMPDILSASDELVYMRWMAFDESARIVAGRPHLFSATGFLDDTWWHRTYWQYGTWMQGGFGGWPKAAIQMPSGRIMVEDSDRLFTFARTKYDSGNGGNVHAGHIGVVKQDYQDMGRVAFGQNPFWLSAVAKPQPSKGTRRKLSDNVQWRTSVPMLVRAMLQADQTLFIAGPPAKTNNQGLEELESNQPGILWAVSAADGKKLAEYKLPSTPVFDGMAAAGKSLYLTTKGGNVRCLGGNE
jgi:outer membrane protein assembly factor BamB